MSNQDVSCCDMADRGETFISVPVPDINSWEPGRPNRLAPSFSSPPSDTWLHLATCLWIKSALH